MSTPTITSVKLSNHPFGYSEAVAAMSDGGSVELFTYYRDEISFSEQEFAGLTVEQARAKRHQRDVEYLQS